MKNQVAQGRGGLPLKEKPVTDIDIHDTSNYLSDTNMMIDFTTRMTIQKHDILPAEEAAIIQGCRSFVAAYRYAASHLPFDNELLQHAEVINVGSRC